MTALVAHITTLVAHFTAPRAHIPTPVAHIPTAALRGGSGQVVRRPAAPFPGWEAPQWKSMNTMAEMNEIERASEMYDSC